MLTRRDIIILAVLILLAVAAALMQTQRPPPLLAHDHAIRTAIATQLQNKNNAPRFIKQKCRPVLDAQSWTFEGRARLATTRPERRIQNLYIRTSKERGLRLRYILEKQAESRWRITDCAVLKGELRDI